MAVQLGASRLTIVVLLLSLGLEQDGVEGSSKFMANSVNYGGSELAELADPEVVVHSLSYVY